MKLSWRRGEGQQWSLDRYSWKQANDSRGPGGKGGGQLARESETEGVGTKGTVGLQ